jgi:hypothetical protein
LGQKVAVCRFIFGTLETTKNIKIFAMPYRPSTLRHSSAYGRIFEQTHKQRGALYTACKPVNRVRAIASDHFSILNKRRRISTFICGVELL